MNEDSSALLKAAMTAPDVIGAGNNVKTGRALKTLNNRNNLANLYLRKQLDHFDKEKTFSISHLDREKFDTLEFLQNIAKIDSDTHPAARTYLGRDPQRTSIRVSAFRRNKTAPVMQHEFENARLSRSLTSLTPPPSKASKHTVTRTQSLNLSRKSLITPHPVQTSTTPNAASQRDCKKSKRKEVRKPSAFVLPSLETRSSIYLRIAKAIQNADTLSNSSCSDSDSDSSECSLTPLQRQSRGRMSILAWVSENQSQEASDKLNNLLKSRPRDRNPTEKRRREFLQWKKEREIRQKQKEEEERKQESVLFLTETPVSPTPMANEPEAMTLPPVPSAAIISVTTSPIIKEVNHEEQKSRIAFSNVGKMVLSSVKQTTNIRDRMKDFFGKVDTMKVVHENEAITPMSKEKRRRWKKLTQGIKAALAESSDEDEGDQNT